MKRILGILISFSVVMVTGCGSLGGFGSNSSAQKADIPVYVPNEKARLVRFSGSEPEGFNGIKWETKLSTVAGMKHYRTDQSAGGIEFYLKKGDGFQLGNGKPAPVQYGFWREKFYVGMVTTGGLTDWNSLKETVFSKFGVGAKPFSNKEEYLWVGKVAVMALRYDENSKRGTFYIRSESMEKQMESIVTMR
jgi:hypothetical protein